MSNQQLEDNDDDSSEDEDYVCDKSETDDDSNSSTESSSTGKDDDDSEATLKETDENESEQEKREPTTNSSKLNGNTEAKKYKQKKTENEVVNGDKKSLNASSSIEKNKMKEHLICCICLNQQSDSQDELVQCDSCGFYTHEGCYGISDTDSKMTSTSSASTEPWFCNACLSHEDETRLVANESPTLKCYARTCELCPNVECGLLKETENGKFVHSVCALYTPGIAYQDIDKLWPVVLDEIPSSRWGEQICSLCDNVLFSRTGICIQCDAGLCKSYFHVTCAQKFGYLLDPAQAQQQNPNDPFIAYCKLHNDKAIINSRKASYLAMISNYRSKHQTNHRLYEFESDKERIHSKFLKAQQNYEISREKVQKLSVERVSKPRMLTTCPSAVKKLIQKLELSKEDAASNDNIIDQQIHHSSSVTFSAEFVKYYFERESKIRQNFKELQEQKELQKNLTKQEVELRKTYDKKYEESKKLAEENRLLKEKFKLYVGLIQSVLPKSEYQHDLIEKLLKEKPTAASHTATVAAASAALTKAASSTLAKKASIGPKPTTTGGKRGRPSLKSLAERNARSPTAAQKPSVSAAAAAALADVAKKKRGRRSLLNSDVLDSKLSISTSCSKCKEKTNSHLFIDCDTCKEFFHITCLEPPLSALPKKTKLFGWECSKCVRKKNKNSSDESPSLVETSMNTVDEKGCVRRVMRRERKRPPRTLSASGSDNKESSQEQKTEREQEQEVEKQSTQQSHDTSMEVAATATAMTKTTTQERPKKKRGRRPKPKEDSSSHNATTTTPTTSGIKRKRGRPPKRLDANHDGNDAERQQQRSSDLGISQSTDASSSASTSAHNPKMASSTTAEPIYIHDEDNNGHDDDLDECKEDTKDQSCLSASSSSSNLVIDEPLSSSECVEATAAVNKRSRSASVSSSNERDNNNTSKNVDGSTPPKQTHHMLLSSPQTEEEATEATKSKKLKA